MKILAVLLAFSVSCLTFAAVPVLKEIQGSWACVFSEGDPLIESEELPPYWIPTPDHMLIEGDSMFEFNYPCELVSRKQVAITNGIIHSVNDTSIRMPLTTMGYWPASISLANDTLVLKTSGVRGDWTEKRYVRTTLDSGTVKWLRKYHVHLHCLHGRWKLETTYDSGYDGNGIVPYHFPFEPQHILVFTSNARIDYSSRTLWLQVNGVAKPFSIVSISSDGKRLDVETMDWYKDRPYQLHYQKE